MSLNSCSRSPPPVLTEFISPAVCASCGGDSGRRDSWYQESAQLWPYGYSRRLRRPHMGERRGMKARGGSAMAVVMGGCDDVP